MTDGLSTQVRIDVKPIGAFKSGLIRQLQVVFERRGLKIQLPLYLRAADVDHESVKFQCQIFSKMGKKKKLHKISITINVLLGDTSV